MEDNNNKNNNFSAENGNNAEQDKGYTVIDKPEGQQNQYNSYSSPPPRRRRFNPLLLIIAVLILGSVFATGMYRFVRRGEAREIAHDVAETVQEVADDIEVAIEDSFESHAENQIIVTRAGDSKEFSEIQIGGAFDVYYSYGEESSYVLEGTEEALENIKSEVKGNKLVVEYDNWINFGWNFDTVVVNVTAPNLSKINLSGAATFNSVDALETKNLTVDLSGASEANMTAWVDEKFTLGLSGASNADITGSAHTFDTDLSGASNLFAAELQTVIADVEASGASTAEVNVSEELEAEASGASYIGYYGDPDVDRDTSGASSIERH